MELDLMIQRYIELCLYQNKLDLKTVKAYRIDLQQFCNFASNSKCFYEKEVIVSYICELNKKNYKIKTVKRKIASLKAFLIYLCHEGIIDNNPFAKIKLKMKEPAILPKTISVDYINALFEYVYEKKKSCSFQSYQYKSVVRDIAVLELLFGTGLRISELCSLKCNDIKIQNYEMKILGKGAKERILPIFERNIVEALTLYEEVFHKNIVETGYFFINKRNQQLSSQSVRNMIHKYCKEANISLHITPHMFRHTFATMLLELDVDVRNIQQLLGHSNILTTQIYTHLTSNKKTEIMKDKNPRSKISVNAG